MIKQVLRSPAFTAVLFVAAIALLLFGGINAILAAPKIQSGDWRGQMGLTDVQTALVENGVVVEGHETLLGETFVKANEDTLKGDVANFQYGVTYNEVLSVRNVNERVFPIDEYVRVTVYKYWAQTDKDGNVIRDDNGVDVRDTTLDPSMIELHFVTDNGWTIDEASSTPERTVLYYDKILGSSKNSETRNSPDSTPFVDKITINGEVATITDTADDGTITYKYDGATFRIKAVVDAVQTHNGDVARVGAWGLKG